MATGIYSITLKDLKEAEKLCLEGKNRTKFLNEKWWKMQDAKSEKKCFERKRHSEKEAKQNA